MARQLYYAILQGVQNYSREWRARVERQKPIIAEPLEGIEPMNIDSLATQKPLHEELTQSITDTLNLTSE